MDIESIRTALKNSDETERLYAVEDIITMRLNDLLPDVIEALPKEESRMVRELMVEGMKALDIKPHFPTIVKYFESSEAYVRNCVIEIFGSQGEESVAFLTSVMDHSDREVRKLILDSLVATGSKYCIPALRAALRDKAPNVQITAVEYLGKINDDESLDDILEIFETSQEPMLRIACIETFIHFGRREVVNRVLDILGGTAMDSFYKPSVFRMVSDCGQSEHLPFLLNFLNNRNTLFFNEIANAVLKIITRDQVTSLPSEYEKYIIGGARDRNIDPDNRIAFMAIAAHINMHGKEQLFEEFAQDEDINVMLVALEKLAEINKQKALEIIELRLKLAEDDIKEDLLGLKMIITEQ